MGVKKVNNDELFRMWVESKEQPTEEFFLTIKDLSEMIGKKYYPNENDLDDLIYGATLYVIEKRHKFTMNDTKTTYSYIVTIIRSYMVGVISKRKRYGTSI